MPHIRAIVFDANVFGKDAEPRLDTIELWAEACDSHGAELWIPRVVALELAEHAVAADRAALDKLAQHSRRRERWGATAINAPDSLTIDAIVLSIESAGATILDIPSDAAVAAIEDQILLRGAATRKSGVKTGAADSAWVRSVIAASMDYEGEGVIIVSADRKALEGTCSQLGLDEPRRVDHLGQLIHLLEDSSNASTQIESEFRGILAKEAIPAELLELTGLQEEIIRHSLLRQGRSFEWEHQGTFLSAAHSPQVIGSVTHDHWSGSVTGRIRMEFDIEVQSSRQDRVGEAVEYCAMTFTVFVEGEVAFAAEAIGLSGPIDFFDVAIRDASSTDLTIEEI